MLNEYKKNKTKPTFNAIWTVRISQHWNYADGSKSENNLDNEWCMCERAEKINCLNCAKTITCMETTRKLSEPPTGDNRKKIERNAFVCGWCSFSTMLFPPFNVRFSFDFHDDTFYIVFYCVTRDGALKQHWTHDKDIPSRFSINVCGCYVHRYTHTSAATPADEMHAFVVMSLENWRIFLRLFLGL